MFLDILMPASFSEFQGKSSSSSSDSSSDSSSEEWDSDEGRSLLEQTEIQKGVKALQRRAKGKFKFEQSTIADIEQQNLQDKDSKAADNKLNTSYQQEYANQSKQKKSKLPTVECWISTSTELLDINVVKQTFRVRMVR